MLIINCVCFVLIIVQCNFKMRNVYFDHAPSESHFLTSICLRDKCAHFTHGFVFKRVTCRVTCYIFYPVIIPRFGLIGIQLPEKYNENFDVRAKALRQVASGS